MKTKAPVSVKHLINSALGFFGLRLVRNKTALNQDDLGLRQILTQLGITVVFDVGASHGQYAERLRRIGYLGRIVSFEPRSAAFSVLRQKTLADTKWEAVCLALGDHAKDQDLNVSQNSWSSSFLPVEPQILHIEPGIESVRAERVSVKPLDEIYMNFVSSGDRTFLKLDVQGYEPNVLAGSREFLCCCRAIQTEMALLPSYKDQISFPEMLALMRQYKFHLLHLERGFWDSRSGFLIEADGIFVHDDHLNQSFILARPSGLAHVA